MLLLLVSWSRAESAGPFEEGLRLYEAGRRTEAIPYFDRALAASVTATVETLNGRVVATRVGSSSPRVLKGIRSSPHPNSVAGAER